MELNSTWMFFELVETEHAVMQSSFKKDGEKLSVPLRSIWNTSSFIISKPYFPQSERSMWISPPPLQRNP
jgi:hypothetical protein